MKFSQNLKVADTVVNLNGNVTKVFKRGSIPLCMKRGYLIVLVVAVLAIASGGIFKSTVKNAEKGEPEHYRIPKERVYVASVVFSDGDATLLGADTDSEGQIKRIAGTYIVRLEKGVLRIEIYSWGSRTLFKEEAFEISNLRQKYPLGVSIWVEQDEDSAVVILIPWQ